MKTFTKYLYSMTLATLLAVGASSCKDDIINIDDNTGAGSETPAGEQLYLALRVYNASSIDAGTRSTGGTDDPTFDSDDKDYKVAGMDFNKGLGRENEIYTGYTSPETSPHFLLIFDLDDKLEYKLPLMDWDYEKTGDEPSYDNSSVNKSYYTFYTSAEKYKIPQNFDNRKVLVVLNAGEAMQKALNNALATHSSYSDVTNLSIANTETDDSKALDFLFFIAPDAGKTPYFTMTSSMVVTPVTTEGDGSTATEDYYGPAVIKRNYTWQANKEDAAKLPIFSFFIERIQAKFTLTFQLPKANHTDNTKYYFASENTEWPDENGYQACAHPVIIAGEDFTPSQEWQKIRFVKNYYSHSDEENHSDNFITTAEEWKINLMGWGVNAVEKEEYMFKKLTSPFNYYSASSPYSDWNPVALSPYRNFWAEGKHYSDTEFPDQYRNAKFLKWDERQKSDENGELMFDSENNPIMEEYYTIKKAEIHKNSDIKSYQDLPGTLKYFNFTALSSRTPHVYSPEHTTVPAIFGSNHDTWEEAYNDQKHLRGSSHIILTAQLLVKGLDDDNVYTARNFNSNGSATDASHQLAPESKYYMNDIFWSSQAYREYVAEYLGYWMQEDEETFGKNDGVFYYDVDEDIERDPANRRRADYEYFDIENLEIKGGDAWVHLTPDPDSNIEEKTVNGQTVVYTKLYTYDPENDTFTQIRRDVFENLVFAHPEYFAQHFYHGRMYYAIPVEHNIRSSADKFYLGKYGVVRNHWYNYTITSFSGLGTPVADPLQPIIPNNERSYESLGLTLSILPWHTLDTEVDISGQRPNLSPDEVDVDLYIKGEDWNYEGQEFGGQNSNDGW